jgi:hypothetical protein
MKPLAQYPPDFGQMANPSLFIQWKGTTLCADFRCECGEQQHICGEMFVYEITCEKCGAKYKTPHTVALVRVVA